MKLYRIKYTDRDNGMCVAWEGTQADAKRKQRELEKEHGRSQVDDFEPYYVPTDKAGLLHFLNTHADRENG